MTNSEAVERLRKYKEDNSLTFEELAAQCGISSSYLSMIFNGRRAASTGIRQRIEGFFNPYPVPVEVRPKEDREVPNLRALFEEVLRLQDHERRMMHDLLVALDNLSNRGAR